MALVSDLPTELLLEIFGDIDHRTIKECRAISRFFRSLIDESIDIQYQLALGAAGYADGPQSPITTPQRLQKLIQHQASWKTLSNQRSDSYLISNRASTYELCGGIYASGVSHLDRTDMTRNLELVEFPSLLRNMNEGHTWTIRDLGFDVRDFGMDPDHNLLIAMEHIPQRRTPSDNPPLCVHLLTLREEEAKPHPLADAPILQYQPQAWNGRYAFWVQVVGDNLALLIMPGRSEEPFCANELVIWKWKTGKMISTIRFEQVAITSFSFLSNDVILAPCVVDLSDSNPIVRPELRLYKLPELEGDHAATLLATYLLPFREEKLADVNLRCWADPSPWVPPPRTAAQRGDGREDDSRTLEVVWPAHGAVPFAPAPLNRIVVLGMLVTLEATWIELRSFTAFVKAESLMKLWRTAADPDGMVCWERWGREHTRFIEEQTNTTYVRQAYGMRYCQMIPTNSWDRSRLRLMDFNDDEFDAMLRQEMDYVEPPMQIVEDDGDEEWTTDSEDEDHEALWGSTRDVVRNFGGLFIRDREERERCARRQVAFHASYIVDPVLFQKPLETALRFRWTTKDGSNTNRVMKVMIDDEHIISIRSSSQVGYRTVEVLTL